MSLGCREDEWLCIRRKQGTVYFGFSSLLTIEAFTRPNTAEHRSKYFDVHRHHSRYTLAIYMAQRWLPRASTANRLIRRSTMVEHTEPSSQPSVVGDTTQLEAPGPSRMVSAADKWVKPNGPPVGVSFGARRLQEDQDVWQHNAW